MPHVAWASGKNLADGSGCCLGECGVGSGRQARRLCAYAGGSGQARVAIENISCHQLTDGVEESSKATTHLRALGE